MKGYYFITDAELSQNGNANDVRDAITAGVKVVQYRNKNGSSREMYDEALVLRKMCLQAGVIFIVNDRIDIALAVDADGVHIGSTDIPYEAARRVLGTGRIIGVSVHTPTEALVFQERGADYLGVGPVFATGTKKDALTPIGVEGVRAICAIKKIPIVAIGGITRTNAGDVAAAGADALCAISAVVASDNVVKSIHEFQEVFS